MSGSTTAPLLVLYVGYLLIATFYPFVLSANSSTPVTELITELLTVKAPSFTDFAQNIGLFVPFGALVYCSLKAPSRSRTGSIVFALVAGGALSLSIEIGQIFFTRHPALSDVLANSLGALCGALLMRLCPLRIGAVLDRSWERLVTSKLFLSFVLLFGTAPLILSIVQMPWPKFRTWDTSLPFQLANEATLDRPWLGRIHLVAVYNRALSSGEIANHFQLGFSSDPVNNRAKKGLVALYTFRERGGNIVRDVSGVGIPLDLLIAPTSHVNWLSSSNGIEIVQPAVIKSQGPASKLAQAFRGSDEISIEAWFTPANLRQKGPARLVSFSEGLKHRNFTLGQQGAEVVFRLRTLISGRSGSAQDLETDDRVLNLEPSHIVATYAQGVERIYVNGVQHSNTLDMTRDVVIGFATRKTAIAQIAYSFFYFFPMALFSAMFFVGRRNGCTFSLLMAVAVGAGLMAITETSQSLLFSRAMDFSLVGYGLIIATLGALAGAGLPTSQLRAIDPISC